MVTGESSGDLLGARLMRALKQQASVKFYGLGGESMQAEGLETLFPISDLAVMGLFEVIPHLKKILSRKRPQSQKFEAEIRKSIGKECDGMPALPEQVQSGLPRKRS